MSNRVINILVPIISIIIGLIVGAIVMVVSGYDPVQGYIALWTGIFGDSYSIGNTIRQITHHQRPTDARDGDGRQIGARQGVDDGRRDENHVGGALEPRPLTVVHPIHRSAEPAGRD